MPRVTVLMPVHNGEAFLADALESLFRQSFDDFEVVVVDDASEDGSHAVLERLKLGDSRLHTVRSDARIGIAAALNKGLSVARGEYVARADADDLSDQTRLARQVEFLDRNSAVAVVGSAMMTTSTRGYVGSLMRFPEHPAEIRRLLPRRNCMGHPSVMFRRRAVLELGGYRFDGVEDYDLWLRISEQHDLANLQDALVRYRLHPGQLAISKVEAFEMRRLVVQAAAKARLHHLGDPLASTDTLTSEIARQMGVPMGRIRGATRDELVERAAFFEEASLGSFSDDLAAYGGVTRNAARRQLASARLLLDAQRAAERHDRLAACLHLLAGGLMAPSYFVRRTLSKGVDLYARFGSR